MFLRFGVDFGYWPLIETPGVAYIVNTGGFAPSAALNRTLMNCWPAVLIVFVTSLIAGFLMWIFVSNVLEITGSCSERRRSRHKYALRGFSCTSQLTKLRLTLCNTFV